MRLKWLGDLIEYRMPLVFSCIANTHKTAKLLKQSSNLRVEIFGQFSLVERLQVEGGRASDDRGDRLLAELGVGDGGQNLQHDVRCNFFAAECVSNEFLAVPFQLRDFVLVGQTRQHGQIVN